MAFVFTPLMQQKVAAAQAAQVPAKEILPALDLAVSAYLCFVWESFWLPSKISLAELERAIAAVSDDQETGAALRKLPRAGLAELLPATRKLVRAGVPLATEFGGMLDEKLQRDRTVLGLLQHLMEQVHEAAGEDVETLLARMADVLQNRLLLRAGERQYRITELEMYYRRDQAHEDVYVHGRDEQLEMGRWFFNDADALDLTFGNSNRARPAWGGILLRGLQRLPLKSLFQYVAPNEDTYVHGPRNVLRDIVAHLNGVFTTLPGLLLEEAPATAAPAAPWRVRRYGLRLKAGDKDAAFLNSAYRFIVDAEYLKGLKDRAAIIRQLGWTPDQARPILGYRPAAQ